MMPALSRDVRKALIPSAQGRTVYVAVGNSLRGDDGVANYIADSLRVHRKDVIVMRAGDRPETVVDRAVEAQPAKAVIVDAADFGGAAGSVRSFDLSCIPENALSTHRFPLAVIAAVLKEDTGTEVTFVGIQVGETEFGSPMGEQVKTSADAIIDFLNLHFR